MGHTDPVKGSLYLYCIILLNETLWTRKLFVTHSIQLSQRIPYQGSPLEGLGYFKIGESQRKTVPMQPGQAFRIPSG